MKRSRNDEFSTKSSRRYSRSPRNKKPRDYLEELTKYSHLLNTGDPNNLIQQLTVVAAASQLFSCLKSPLSMNNRDLLENPLAKLTKNFKKQGSSREKSSKYQNFRSSEYGKDRSKSRHDSNYNRSYVDDRSVRAIKSDFKYEHSYESAYHDNHKSSIHNRSPATTSRKFAAVSVRKQAKSPKHSSLRRHSSRQDAKKHHSGQSSSKHALQKRSRNSSPRKKAPQESTSGYRKHSKQPVSAAQLEDPDFSSASADGDHHSCHNNHKLLIHQHHQHKGPRTPSSPPIPREDSIQHSDGEIIEQEESDDKISLPSAYNVKKVGSRSPSGEIHSDSANSATHNKKSTQHLDDDNNGHLIYKLGYKIKSRYKITKTLGEGTFGKVVECIDEKRNCERVAIKVIKNIEKYREAAMLEINVLKFLQEKDPKGKNLCIRMFDSFNLNGHICITFQLLGLSVFSFLKDNQFSPYPIDQVRHIGYQMCQAVHFLHRYGLTHTDLKPENILFVCSDFSVVSTADKNHHSGKEAGDSGSKKRQSYNLINSSEIRLIDFGSATFDHEKHSSIVSTRHYRAPEVILELGWSQPCDVWSIGCIMFELFTGHTLFQTHDNREHLAMMKRVIGKMPYKMAKNSQKSYFDSDGNLVWNPSDKDEKFVRDNCKKLSSYCKSDNADCRQLFDLMQQMLDYDPKMRVALGDALKHAFFQRPLGTSSNTTKNGGSKSAATVGGSNSSKKHEDSKKSSHRRHAGSSIRHRRHSSSDKKKSSKTTSKSGGGHRRY